MMRGGYLWLWAASLVATGCVIYDDPSFEGGLDDFPGDAESGVFDDFPEGDNGESPPPLPDDDDDGDTTGPVADDESGGPDPQCGDNVLNDGGFELGTPNRAWTESSPLFDTPICDDGCSTDPGAEPYAGAWFAWFGGAQRPDVASLTQAFSISADAAQLRFRFSINAASGTGDDVFAVQVDGNTVFMRTDADIADFGDYVLVTLTLDQWADGAQHELRFESEVFGGGLTNFFVDDVEVVGCGEIDETTGSVDETGSDSEGSSSGGSSSGGSSSDGSSSDGSSSDSSSSGGSSSDGSSSDGSSSGGSSTNTGGTAG